MSGPVKPSKNMDTSKQIKHVFGCQGVTMHLTLGSELLKSSDPTKCPQCGADVYDASNTPVGQLYLGHIRATSKDLPS